MGERYFDNVNSTQDLLIHAGIVLHSINERGGNGRPHQFEVFTKAFANTPNFVEIYKGNLEKYNNNSILAIESTDARVERRWGNIIGSKSYVPATYKLSQYTPYKECGYGVVRLVYKSFPVGQSYQEFYPKAKIENNLLYLGEPELVTVPSQEDLATWNNLLSDVKSFNFY